LRFTSFCPQPLIFPCPGTTNGSLPYGVSFTTIYSIFQTSESVILVPSKKIKSNGRKMGLAEKGTLCRVYLNNQIIYGIVPKSSTLNNRAWKFPVTLDCPRNSHFAKQIQSPGKYVNSRLDLSKYIRYLLWQLIETRRSGTFCRVSDNLTVTCRRFFGSFFMFC
jgi:hypothetical protein